MPLVRVGAGAARAAGDDRRGLLGLLVGSDTWRSLPASPLCDTMMV